MLSFCVVVFLSSLFMVMDVLVIVKNGYCSSKMNGNLIKMVVNGFVVQNVLFKLGV